jgi:hypothetical protein
MNKNTEYDTVRAETLKIQDCITEYMKMFFAASAATVGVILFFFRDESKPFPTSDVGGYALLLLSLMVISFTSIIFHKFNTHNRYTGYARALSYEYVSPDSYTDEEYDTLIKYLSVSLWEICLSIIYGKQMGIGAIDSSWPEQKKRVALALQTIRGDNAANKTIAYLRVAKTFIGGWMVLRTPISRYSTRSWTYPYPISVALFAVGAFLIIGWALIATKLSIIHLYF